MIDRNTLYTLKQISALAGRSYSGLYYHYIAGRLCQPSVRIGGRRYWTEQQKNEICRYVRELDLDKVINERTAMNEVEYHEVTGVAGEIPSQTL